MSIRSANRLVMTLAALAIIVTLLFTAGATAQQLAGQMFREDVDGNGYVNVMDVLKLVLIGRGNSGDPRADYDGDGVYGPGDVLLLCRNIVERRLTSLGSPELAWRRLGPGGGGAMFLPTFDPFDSDHAFVRCDMTGSYVTFDSGESWRMFNLRTVVYDFEFDPNRPDVAWAGNEGLYRTLDGGRTWNLVYPAPADVLAEHMVGDHAEQFYQTADGTTERTVVKIRVDPANSDRIWIGLSYPWWDGPSVVMMSEDNGASWNEVVSGLDGLVLGLLPGSWWDNSSELTVITRQKAVRLDLSSGAQTELTMPDNELIEVDAGADSTGAVIYALSAARKSGGDLAGGLFRSGDGGMSWTQLTDSLTASWRTSANAPTFNTVAACGGTPSVVYVSIGDMETTSNTHDFGVLKSTDSGTTWKWVLKADWSGLRSGNFEESWMTRNLGFGWSGSPISLGVSPTNPDVCMGTDYGRAYGTTDGGALWRQLYSNNVGENAYSSRGLDVTTCYGVHFDPFDSLHIFTTYTDIGLFQSYDGGESWVHAVGGITGGVQNTCYWLEFDPDVEGRIWSVWSNWHDLPRMKMFNANWPNALGMPAVSTNGGRTWSGRTFGMPGNAPQTHILIDPDSPVDNRTLYVCAFGAGVYKSVDAGNRWQDASAGLGSNRSAWRITRAPDGTLFLVVVRNGRESAVIPGALYRSTDGAASWQSLPLPEGVSGPNDLAIDPSDPGRLYLSCWPQSDRSVNPARERNGGLYRSEDSGQSWELVFDESAHVYAAAVDPRRPATVVIGTFDSAAFRSDDRGKTWYRLRGYDFKWGHRPVFDPHNSGMLYLTTFGGGMFHGPAVGVPDASESIKDSGFLRWR